MTSNAWDISKSKVQKFLEDLGAEDPQLLSAAKEIIWPLISKCDELVVEFNERDADRLRQLNQSLGWAYPSRAVVEYALESQAGATLNLKRAREEFNIVVDQRAKEKYQSKYGVDG